MSLRMNDDLVSKGITSYCVTSPVANFRVVVDIHFYVSYYGYI